jgi:hypothetical protein
MLLAARVSVGARKASVRSGTYITTKRAKSG